MPVPRLNNACETPTGRPMRFYLKLMLMLALFVGLVSATGRRMTGNLAYEARVAFVYTFGSEADHERLIEYTGRRIAIQQGYLDEYLARERFRCSEAGATASPGVQCRRLSFDRDASQHDQPLLGGAP